MLFGVLWGRPARGTETGAAQVCGQSGGPRERAAEAEAVSVRAAEGAVREGAGGGCNGSVFPRRRGAARVGVDLPAWGGQSDEEGWRSPVLLLWPLREGGMGPSRDRAISVGDGGGEVLRVDVQAEILRLHYASGLGSRRIAAQLGVNRKAVKRVIRRRQVMLGRVPATGRPSQLDPFGETVRRLLEEAPERSAVNILQRLREAGYTGGYTILKEAVAEMRPREPKEAFVKLEFAPGEAAQVDWGEFGDVFGDGVKVHAFVMVLCYSRKLYVEFTRRETLGSLLRSDDRALRYFGGVCREYWHDNCPAVLAERAGSLVRFTARFWAYAGFHWFKPIVCRPYAGHEKGRVEDAVKLVRYSFWPGRRFADFGDLNGQAAGWRDQYANRREHRATGKVPDLVFEASERMHLGALRNEAYETDDVTSARVDPFGRVRFDRNEYSVPWTLVGKMLVVKGDDSEVRLYYGPRRVAGHARCYQSGREVVNPKHSEGLAEVKPGAETSWQRRAIAGWGSNARRYLELVPQGTRSLRHELSELLVLGTVYGPARVEGALGALLGRGQVGVAHVERVLRLAEEAPVALPPLRLSDPRLAVLPPAPDLREYDALLLDGRGEEEP